MPLTTDRIIVALCEAAHTHGGWTISHLEWGDSVDKLLVYDYDGRCRGTISIEGLRLCRELSQHISGMET